NLVQFFDNSESDYKVKEDLYSDINKNSYFDIDEDSYSNIDNNSYSDNESSSEDNVFRNPNKSLVTNIKNLIKKLQQC
ncbi:10038_t:CDS:1, partial [Racocetra persica]